MTDRVWSRLAAPRDAAALAAFRVAFGLLVFVSAVRFLAFGWVDLFFVSPSFHFKYWGFEWVPALPAPWMHAVFVLLALAGLFVALGLFYRAAIVTVVVAFTYVQLVDVTTYLNHYYLVSLLAGLLCIVPAHRFFSLDARRKPALASATLPTGFTYLLRFQVAVVYIFAGLAKLTPDWLLAAQPLNIWLNARTDLPLVGSYLAERWAAYAASWFGFLFDTTIVLFLLWRRTRPVAYAVVIAFHAATLALFPIGMFPVIMVTAALVFFDADWPRKLLRSSPAVLPAATTPPWPRATVRGTALACFALYALAQLALPLRSHLYGGNVLWHEQGMRFSWRVMAREKNGSVTFHVRDPATGKTQQLSPRRYLNRIQEREMSVQPDLILQLARHIAREHAAKAGHPVEVRVDAIASLNGRPATPLVDPEVDLARLEDGLAPKGWILPASTHPPPALYPVAHRARVR